LEIVNILLVEDNEGDILLMSEALEEAKMHLKLSVVRDGKEAIDFVSKQGKYTEAAMPDMLLLDVNLPKKNGFEVLQFIKMNEGLKHIPVIMLTTSSSEKDINTSYSNFASCFITKPEEINEFLSVVAIIEKFWLSTVKLPTQKFKKID
jgi:CheY-like chemotaxis protein